MRLNKSLQLYWRPPPDRKDHVRLMVQYLGLVLSSLLLHLLTLPSCGKENVNLAVSQICEANRDGNFMSNIPRKIDGVVIESQDERDVDCVITFQTESVLTKFLLRFDRLKIDCNDHLYIYDGAHDTGSPRAHITCDSVANKVGSNGFIITRTNFVTLKYKTDSWGTENVGFTLVITAFKNARESGCREGYQCDSFFCISQDLVCDGVHHCGHGQDEGVSNNCAGTGLLPMLGLETGQLIGVVGLLVLLLLGGGAAAWIWTCRINRDQQTRSTLVANSYQMQGEGEYMNGVTTTIIDRNGSGNMRLPVQGREYKRCRGLLWLG
ncbi:uncharacterized protein LOC111710045 [Eurytemora carolleeae]|uniref:uncharacterized protein LOC111710045 n=1 Tax=Eurytemora carolleeae TaxID=1294199 RepID=UPI000C77F5F7|nr:uncharacterized protein LOC111710045 [Eurytemora carolleeae]|eukprot:XP_023339860.1 uncharacterized protein LOC111710045 [Eurytemora affinis]